jgi:integrase/recombinase XerD
MTSTKGRPKGTGTGKARELTVPEIERLTAVTTNLRDRALIWICLGAGLRVGEAVTMTVGRVGPDYVVVEKSRAKGGETRRTFMTPQAIAHVQAYLATRGAPGPNEALFPSRQGGGTMRPNWGVRLVEKLFVHAGIHGATSHSLRRSHANTLRRNGVDIVTIKEQLGHAHLNTTALYLAVTDAERADALKSIVFGGAPANHNAESDRVRTAVKAP